MAQDDVHLQISTNSNSPTPPWTEVTGSDGTTKFWYKWSGGGDRPVSEPNGVGNNRYDADGTTRTFDVDITGAGKDDYQFTAFNNKSENPPSQVTGVVGITGAIVTVTDLCTLPTTGETDYNWGVTVERISDNVTFDADPVITNVGSGPRV